MEWAILLDVSGGILHALLDTALCNFQSLSRSLPKETNFMCRDQRYVWNYAWVSGMSYTSVLDVCVGQHQDKEWHQMIFLIWDVDFCYLVCTFFVWELSKTLTIWIRGFFLSESGDFYCAKSKFCCVLIMFLMIETDSAPSKTPRATKIPELDSFNLDFEKIRPDFFKIMLEKFVHSGSNRRGFRLRVSVCSFFCDYFLESCEW